MDANTILLIEDSLTQAKIIAQRFSYLTSFNHIMAQTMAEAESLALAHRDAIFAAVVDRNLPDAPDGEAVDLCLSHGIPCVVLTATFDEDLRHRFIEKSVADYFFKGSIEDLEPLIASVSRLYANYAVRALVVDDSSVQRAIVRKMLAVQCISCVEAADGVEALEVLAADPDISLVITDFEMPRMDGIQLVQEIRVKHKVNRMAVIGISSVGSGTLTAKFLKYGANDFLTKPFEAEEFYWRVNQTLNVLDVMEELRALRRDA